MSISSISGPVFHIESSSRLRNLAIAAFSVGIVFEIVAVLAWTGVLPAGVGTIVAIATTSTAGVTNLTGLVLLVAHFLRKGSEHAENPDTLPQAEPEMTSVRIKSQDYANYKKWILSKAAHKKKVLLENTVLKVRVKDRKEEVHSISLPDSSFKAQLKQTFADVKFKMTFKKSYYDYSKEGHYYVLFGSEENLGGGYRRNGNVQEEIAFFEFPRLAEIDYFTRKHPIKLCQNNARHQEPMPRLFKDVRRRFKISNDLYGKKLLTAKDRHIRKAISSVGREEQCPVNLLDIAAMSWDVKGSTYSGKDLQFLLKTFYLACAMAGEGAVVHSGRWGCGAYNNSEKTMILIQMLGAKMARVQLVFHALGKDLRRFARDDAKDILDTHQTPLEVMNYIFQTQKIDKSWAPFGKVK